MGRVSVRFTRAGYTLVELLVIISILAILMGIVFPVIARSRERAYEAVCMNNLRQLGAALEIYRADHGGLFPIFLRKDLFAAYISDGETFICPSDPTQGVQQWYDPPSHPDFPPENYPRSYNYPTRLWVTPTHPVTGGPNPYFDFFYQDWLVQGDMPLILDRHHRIRFDHRPHVTAEEMLLNDWLGLFADGSASFFRPPAAAEAIGWPWRGPEGSVP